MFKKSNILVSICIPTYNGEVYLAEALQSVIDQTYKPLEIVISDDASKDKTLDIIKEYQTKTDIPFFIYHHKPSGIGANWNNCVKHANGEYIKFLFQDDRLLPDCVENLYKLARQEPSPGIVFCERNFIDNIQNAWSKRLIERNHNLFPEWIDQNIMEGKYILKCSNIFSYPQNIFGEPIASLIKKELFDMAGYFSERLKQKLDTEFWYRCCPYTTVGFLKEKLVEFRINQDQATHSYSLVDKSHENILFYSSMLKGPGKYLTPKMKVLLIYNISYTYIKMVAKRILK